MNCLAAPDPGSILKCAQMGSRCQTVHDKVHPDLRESRDPRKGSVSAHTVSYLQVLDSVTTKPYCLVYFHTGCTGRRRDLEFLQRLLSNCPSRYQSNLTNVYSVHASTIHKVSVNM